jgi:hypothetical protein
MAGSISTTLQKVQYLAFQSSVALWRSSEGLWGSDAAPVIWRYIGYQSRLDPPFAVQLWRTSTTISFDSSYYQLLTAYLSQICVELPTETG